MEPPAKSKMAARGPQNGQRGLKRGPTLGYLALRSLLLNDFFWSEHSSYEKHKRRRKKNNINLAAPGALANRLQRRTAHQANEANLDPPN